MDGLVLLYVRLQATEGSMNDALQHQGFCGGSVCTSNIYIYITKLINFVRCYQHIKQYHKYSSNRKIHNTHK